MIHKKTNNIVVVILTVIVLLSGTVALFSFTSSPKRSDDECKHNFGEYTETVKPGLFSVGERKKICKKCDEEIVERVNATVSLPQMYLDGNTDFIAKDRACMVKADYTDGDIVIDAYATIKYQGHTSMAFDKKNFTIKFYEDESEDKKYKFSLNGWEATNKYCLKANYIDRSGARNVVSSNIWSDVVASRKNLDKSIAETEFKGGIDGYPFALFINNEYQGLYTFNIPKDEVTYNIADEENEAMFVINSCFSQAANFRSLLSEEDKDAVFDLEYSYNDDNEWPYESINTLIGFVMNNDGEDFRRGIGRYLDVDAAIDYLATAYVLGVTDNFAKNMILITYDSQKWIPNMYDLDTACGLAFDGTKYYEHDFSVPEVMNDGKIKSGTDNLLWDRILNNYTDEFKARYSELRKDILATDKLIKRYSDFIHSVPAECYTQDISLYRDTPFADIDQVKQISEFMKARTALMDSIVENM